MVCIKPNTLTVRFFDDGVEWGDPYRAVATVQLLSDKTAYVSGLMGEITRKDYRDLMRELRDRHGVRDVQWHRSRPDEFRSVQHTTAASLIPCRIAELN